jgi:small-conductance mechanosensitive channel
MVLYLVSLLLNILEIKRPLLDWVTRNLEYKWVIGTLSVSIGGILLLILILLATLLVSRFFKVLIEDEIGSRVRLPKGVPFAISVTIRYFIVILGFVFALSAAGINLGEFGLIAGALGIGIGFGLQNIVGNFISGLILIYERPVQTGDTIEVETLMGQVKRIGVRSSSVRTYDGAEVVVPNSNLVSNQLINWTLSDNRRRIEIRVGVAYGSDPNVVLELLKTVAQEHENVLPDPEPLALFEEFGDSSLNFRLLFWVHFEKGFTTKSDVSIGIYNILKENNITIPFPQMDVYVKRDE